jgi:hypothetical protein
LTTCQPAAQKQYDGTGAGEATGWLLVLRSSVLIEPERAGNVYVGRVADPDGYQIEINDDV